MDDNSVPVVEDGEGVKRGRQTGSFSIGQACRGKAWIGFSGRVTADELRDRLDLICFQLHQSSPCTCIKELGRLPFLYAAYKVFFRFPDCMCF